MTNMNGFSDSQESALLEDDVFSELQREIGSQTLPLLTDNMLDEVEEKYSFTQQYTECTEIKNESSDREYYQETAAPIREEFAGCYDFQFSLANQGSSKHWVYSQILRKVFILMDETLPVRFKWDPPEDGLFLRTTMVFSLDQYASDPVKRCHNHVAAVNTNNRDIDPRIIKHVVRCLDHSSMYEERNEHLSVLTPLHTPQAGSQYVLMNFKFLCKNSCPSGMNRRPTELIFNLEDSKRTVLGRRRLLVRVCSCPKRDLKKEESEVTEAQPEVKKRKLCLPVAKKMMPSCDTHVFKVQLNIIGKENYLAVLKYAYDIMAGQASRTGHYEFFKPYMDDILRKTP
ncbi:PREDICTED: cellular tumor antigen p53 [Dufourea novaeangliae]|uniref:Cellular tumor antigen p53 n=1 Tax=Dufourea novaeangliae TaxID=178035 RepID=A0A154PH19_DUFNO|nr:PREDICTED: cellular tumor antigen p53 [Dufourea novaeangliae]KZC11155.1 Cellular tumor antigen p53 [Dufourea novaeangliae]